MNYTGNKNIPGVIHKIVNNIPRHKIYWELFAGSGAIGKSLPSITVKHFNDIDISVLDRLSVGAGDFKHSFDALELLQYLSKSGTDTFLFCDPPYLLSTREYRKYYQCEMLEGDHRDFLELALDLK